MAKQESYNNLIDISISYEEDPELAGKTGEVYKKILSDYFFKEETYESKKMDLFFENFEVPSFVKKQKSILDVDMQEMSQYINGDMINNSLCGQIFLSQAYLKSFYSNYPSTFNKLPDDVKEEVFNKIKSKNMLILNAFKKMVDDRDAAKNRKILTLVALILKNIHKKTGYPLKNLERKAGEIIQNIFNSCDEVFNASQKQLADIGDDTKIKELIKNFFIIKKFQEVTEIAKLFKSELERYKKRVLRV